MLGEQKSPTQCVAVSWPGYWPSYWQTPYLEVSWQGSFADQSTQGNGLQYKRNRFYDPNTGRFTQEDPAGLAGGINAYGFANGDPANFSDPLGLDCRVIATGKPCPTAFSAFVAGVTAKISDIKAALAKVLDKLEIDEPLPKAKPGKWGSPQRGTSEKGYRLDPGHPGRDPSDPEAGDHINWYDWSKGKKGSGGKWGAEPIESPKSPPAPDVPTEVEPVEPVIPLEPL